MILDPTIRLEAVLAGAVATNQPEVHVDYTTWNYDTQQAKPAVYRTALNSNTDVTILAAPVPQGYALEVTTLSIFNKDTTSVTVTVKTDDGTTERIIIKRTLLTLESLHWTKDFGWAVMTNPASTWATYVPVRTSWTDVGSPTVTARYIQFGNICYFQIKVVPATSVATVAGTSYVSLPVTAGTSAIGGDANMVNLSTLVADGSGVIDTANSRVYVPTQTATANTLIISGWYEV